MGEVYQKSDYRINYMTHKPYCYKATCTSVYDGDSITLDINLGFNMVMHNQKIRLLGINTPEIRGDERESGLISPHRLRELIEGKDVLMLSHRDKTGKYGRWLATIYIDGLDVNQLLVDEGLAEVY